MIRKALSLIFSFNSSVTTLPPKVSEPTSSSSTREVASQSFKTRLESGQTSITNRAHSGSTKELMEESKKFLEESEKLLGNVKKRRKDEGKDIEDVSKPTTSSSTSMVASQSLNKRPELDMTSLATRKHPLTLKELEIFVKERKELKEQELQEQKRKKELALFKNEIEDAQVDISPSSVTSQKISVFLKNLSEELQNESPATFEGLVAIVSELAVLGFSDKKPKEQVPEFFHGLKDTVNDDWAQKTAQNIESLSVEPKLKEKLASSLDFIYNYAHNEKSTKIETPFSQLKDRIEGIIPPTRMKEEQELSVHQEKKRKVS